jgi:hypothetical protein
VFAVSAVFAASALAKKDPWNLNTWGQYKYCPYEEVNKLGGANCFYGRTSGGKEGGEFFYGSVRVLLKQPIVIQGGYAGIEEEEYQAYAATNGENLISSDEPVVKGLKTITPKIQEQAKWPEALMASFKAAKEAKETKATVNIEMAGNECFEELECVDVEHLIGQYGTAFKLALKVTIKNAWLEKLGGGPCTIGSDEHPIKQNLTTGGAGLVGEVSFNEEFTQAEIEGSRLVDTKWHIPQASGASGCGNAEWETYIDKALNIALEVENASGQELKSITGVTWLTGNLHDANAHSVATVGVESGEV